MVIVIPEVALPVRDTEASMPNFSASPIVWSDTASGVRISTGLPVCRRMFSAHTSCIGVLPSPQSAKIAPRPFRMAQSTSAAWNGNRNSGIHTGSKPSIPSSCVFRSRKSA